MGTNFLNFWNIYLIYHVKPTKDHQVLLLLENCESHITAPAITKCQDNEVRMFTLTPHTRHWLDVSLAHLGSSTM